MPQAPLQPCAAPRCPLLVTRAASYCSKHQGLAADPRGSAWRRGYDAFWHGWRRAVLEREPLCRSCRAAGRIVAALEVDHIVPKRLGGVESWENLQPLCKPCHSRKTLSEGGRLY